MSRYLAYVCAALRSDNPVLYAILAAGVVMFILYAMAVME